MTKTKCQLCGKVEADEKPHDMKQHRLARQARRTVDRIYSHYTAEELARMRKVNARVGAQ